MFDKHKEPSELSPKRPAIVLVCAAVGILLSFGLCGISGGSGGGVRGAMTDLGFFLFFVSLATIPIAILWLIVIVLVNVFRHPRRS